MGRIIKELERIYGVKTGRGGDKTSNPQVAESKSQSEIAKELGMSVDKMNRLKKLAELPDEYQDMIETGKISVNTAASIISKLSEDEQNLLLKDLPSAQKFTQAQVQEYIDEIKGLKQDKQELQEEAVEAVKMAKGAAKASDDSAEYLRMKEAKETAEEERRRYYEKWKEEEKKSKGLSADEVQKKVDEAVAKTKQEYRKLVDSQEKTIAELQDQEPETVEVEVVPDDYEELKAEVERLRKEASRKAPREPQIRVVDSDTSKEELARIYFNDIQNSSGTFLAEMEGLALSKDLCNYLPPKERAALAENFRLIASRADEMLGYIWKANKEAIA